MISFICETQKVKQKKTKGFIDTESKLVTAREESVGGKISEGD